jgi:hypothetical protein
MEVGGPESALHQGVDGEDCPESLVSISANSSRAEEAD